LLTCCFLRCLPCCCCLPTCHPQSHLYNLFLNVVSGIRIPPGETSTDLAVLAAIASSVANVPLPPGTALLGEVGLAGELRQVAQLEVRGGMKDV
jgi:predicted ATP-dependent serine protease